MNYYDIKREEKWNLIDIRGFIFKDLKGLVMSFIFLGVF